MTTNDTPFNNPGASPALVEMWRNNLRKSQQRMPPPPVLPTSININFDGGGQPLFAGLGGIAEVTFPCRILGCHIFSGVVTSLGPEPIASTASVYLGLAAQGAWAVGAQPLFATVPPTITALAEQNVDISGWVLDLQPGDLICYGLLSFTGTATFLSLTLPLRRLDATGLGLTPVTDSNGDAFTDSNGNAFVIRG